jgi:hypothetical protein
VYLPVYLLTQFLVKHENDSSSFGIVCRSSESFSVRERSAPVYYPGDKTTLEGGDIVGAHRIGDVYTDDSGRQIVPLGLVVSEHRFKTYEEGEFPQNLHISTGVAHNTFLITDKRPRIQASAEGGDDEEEVALPESEVDNGADADLQTDAEDEPSVSDADTEPFGAAPEFAVNLEDAAVAAER